MSNGNILTQSQIESGRDIPLKELLYAKRVFDNYLLIAKGSRPVELLAEMKEAVKGVEYFKTDSDPCEARNVLSAMFAEVETSESFEQFNELAKNPCAALDVLIEDRVLLIKKERELLVKYGYDVSKI
ncbi:hypothetical protein P7F88_00290 [Vibrio hannami]|uniref:hypothetical protein n=1 Tax=Vibrio hannami TaxID=2717094 RepID=UPI00240F4A88|nr:hypothetical protein [Vibrio hannami]MDG3084614.1 hypothetical protein [Vibrio hannami]